MTKSIEIPIVPKLVGDTALENLTAVLNRIAASQAKPNKTIGEIRYENAILARGFRVQAARVGGRAMYEHVKALLEMAEWLQAHGEGELAEQCKATARKILDVAAYAQYVNRQRGACKGKSRETERSTRCATPRSDAVLQAGTQP